MNEDLRMRKKYLLSLLILLATSILFGQEKIWPLNLGYTDLSPEEVKAKTEAKEDFTLLDVREEEEFKAGHLPGAKLIPLGEIEKRYSELNPEKEIVVYCRSGRRSALASKKLVRLGFKKVKDMQGGINSWNYGLIKEKGGNNL